MRKTIAPFLILGAIFLLPLKGWCQDQKDQKEEYPDSTRYYINIGYLTNIKKNSETLKADAGASFRVGLLTKKRLGFYVGYVFFKEYHQASADYDDEGYGFIGGIDFLLLRKKSTKLYVKAGLFNEKYKSTYRNGRIEIESSLKPDFGLLLNINHLNTYLGWQPSDPSHINIGIGLTF